MKWKEFKSNLEDQGVTDDMEIDEIEIHDPDAFDKLDVNIYSDSTFTVYD